MASNRCALPLYGTLAADMLQDSEAFSLQVTALWLTLSPSAIV